jgi:NADPH:quinone reductase
MLAVQVTRFGAPDVLVAHEVPDPKPGPGEAVIAVSAVDVLFVEAQIRTGWAQDYWQMRPPYVPGDGVAGEVVAVGDGVDATWLGRRAVGYTGSQNAYVEQAVVPADKLVAVPDGVGLAEAAALSHDGPMALTLVDATGIRPDDTVLVLGANGGAGILVVQLAHTAGARVIGAARGEHKGEFVRDAGADVVVDPSKPDWLAQVRAACPGGVDVVFDGVGGAIGAAAVEALADGGRFFAYGASTGEFAAVDRTETDRRGITVYGLDTLGRAREEMTALSARAMAEVAVGRIRLTIGATFPLSRAAEAHAAMESRDVLGKILLGT